MATFLRRLPRKLSAMARKGNSKGFGSFNKPSPTSVQNPNRYVHIDSIYDEQMSVLSKNTSTQALEELPAPRHQPQKAQAIFQHAASMGFLSVLLQSPLMWERIGPMPFGASIAYRESQVRSFTGVSLSSKGFRCGLSTESLMRSCSSNGESSSMKLHQ
eukprot:6484908-Amphidinium_carterae.3